MIEGLNKEVYVFEGVMILRGWKEGDEVESESESEV